MTVTLAPTADLRTVAGPERLFELLAPFLGTINCVAFTIPAGFVTDFASVPHVFHNIVDDDDPDILRPSLLHDWLYQWAGEPPGTDFEFTRSQADECLRESMAACGSGWLRRWTVWSSVRAGGAKAWNTHHIRRAILRADAKHAKLTRP